MKMAGRPGNANCFQWSCCCGIFVVIALLGLSLLLTALTLTITVQIVNRTLVTVLSEVPNRYRITGPMMRIGGSCATAKIRIHRARSRLRKALEAQCEFSHDPDDVFRCDRKP